MNRPVELYDREIYRIIAENTTDTIILVDHEGMTLYASPSLSELIGYKPEEYQGTDAFAIIPEEDRGKVHSSYSYVLANKVSDEVGYRLIHKEGYSLYVETRVKPVLDDLGEVKYVVAVVRDVTAKKRTELALEESEQRYKSLFENNLDGVFTIDLDGYYLVNGNRAFERIAGVNVDALKRRCFIGILHDEDHTAVYETLHTITQLGQPNHIECRLAVSSWQEEHIVSITFVPIFYPVV